MKYALIVAGLMVTSALAQPKPDFSGTWKTAESSDQNSHIERIVHQNPNLSLNSQIRFVNSRLSGGSSDNFTYVIDGVERPSTAGNGAQFWRTNSWEGSTLVFLTVRKDGYHVVVTREVWSLSDDGNTLNKAKRVVDMDGVTESIQTFVRQ
ncbi:MAG: hypothetical protein WDO73_11170 [Ignavibacteriota bacterium]